ncbi:MAG: cell division protein FtsZ, partial [Candidatus Pacearchaeota archaeon]
NATGALINITGGLDMKLEEAKKIIEEVSKRISPDAKLIWGAQLSEDMGKTLRVLLIVTGVESPQIMGKGKLKERELEALEEDFGIDFFEAE